MGYMYADLINVSWWGIGSDTLGEAAYSTPLYQQGWKVRVAVGWKYWIWGTVRTILGSFRCLRA